MTEVARIKTVLTGFLGAPGYSTFHYTKTTVVDWQTMGAAAVVLVDAAWAAIKGSLPVAMTMTTLGTVDIIDDLTGQLTSSFVVTPKVTVGTNLSGFGPLASGIRLRYNTAGFVNGKRVRGGTFIVPIADLLGESNGTPSAATLTNLALFYPQLQSASQPNLKFSVYSRPTHATLSHPTPRPGSVHTVTSSTVKDTFAVLRSRRD